MVYGSSKTVTTAGTPEALTSSRVPAVWVKIMAKSGNVGAVYLVGVNESTKNANTNSSGVEITPGSVVELLPCSDTNFYELSKIFIDVQVSGDGVKFNYGRR